MKYLHCQQGPYLMKFSFYTYFFACEINIKIQASVYFKVKQNDFLIKI